MKKKEILIEFPEDLCELAERAARLKGLTFEEFLKFLIEWFYEEHVKPAEERRRFKGIEE